MRDVRQFSELEHQVAGIDTWKDETRSAVALELAAARLLASVAAPVMPGFSTRLTAALGLSGPATWPTTVELVPAGTPIDLGITFFRGKDA